MYIICIVSVLFKFFHYNLGTVNILQTLNGAAGWKCLNASGIGRCVHEQVQLDGFIIITVGTNILS